MPRQRARRGSGSIVRRPDGRYQAQWSGGRDGAGKRIRKSETFPIRDDAEWWLRQLNRTGVAPDTGLTVAEYLERWLAAVQPTMRPSTWRSYAGHVRHHIVPMLGEYRVSALLPRHVEALIEDRLRAKSRHGRPLSPTTVGLIVTTLRIALARGVRRRELPDNAAADVTLPRKVERNVPVLTARDAAALIDAVRGTWVEQIVRFLLGSGLRLGEACGLNQGDLLLDQGYVRLRISKTKLRAVPVSADGLAALREALAAAPRVGKSEPVFFSPRANRAGQRDRLSGTSVTHALPRILEAAGVSRLTPHGLRHGTASLLLAGGTPMRVIAEQLGHANPAMTAKVYAHVVPELQRSALDLLDEAVKRR